MILRLIQGNVKGLEEAHLLARGIVKHFCSPRVQSGITAVQKKVHQRGMKDGFSREGVAGKPCDFVEADKSDAEKPRRRGKERASPCIIRSYLLFLMSRTNFSATNARDFIYNKCGNPARRRRRATFRIIAKSIGRRRMNVFLGPYSLLNLIANLPNFRVHWCALLFTNGLLCTRGRKHGSKKNMPGHVL